MIFIFSWKSDCICAITFFRILSVIRVHFPVYFSTGFSIKVGMHPASDSRATLWIFMIGRQHVRYLYYLVHVFSSFHTLALPDQAQELFLQLLLLGSTEPHCEDSQISKMISYRHYDRNEFFYDFNTICENNIKYRHTQCDIKPK